MWARSIIVASLSSNRLYCGFFLYFWLSHLSVYLCSSSSSILRILSPLFTVISFIISPLSMMTISSICWQFQSVYFQTRLTNPHSPDFSSHTLFFPWKIIIGVNLSESKSAWVRNRPNKVINYLVMKGQVKKESTMAATDTKSRPNRKVTDKGQGQLRRQQIQ